MTVCFADESQTKGRLCRGRDCTHLSEVAVFTVARAYRYRIILYWLLVAEGCSAVLLLRTRVNASSREVKPDDNADCILITISLERPGRNKAKS